MAITARAEGTWAEYTADGTVAVPAAQLTGDLMVILAAWKDFSHTAVISGWTEITEFADGAIAKGASTGSMTVGAWYKVATSDTEADPTLDWTTLGSNDIAGAVCIVFQKGAGEEWGTPAFATAAMTNWTTTSQVVTASTDPGITAGDLLIGLIGIRDDSATMTRGASALAAASVTFGTYTEYPATHLSTTTGFDMSADAGYRIASSGTSSAAPTMEGTISAAETGAALWIRARVSIATTVNAEVATATGAANAPSLLLTTNAGVATGTGAALAATTLLTVNAGVATATGLANNATTLLTTNAGLAAAIGQAYSPTIQLGLNAGLATGTGAALGPAANITVNPGVATGTGLANNATADTVAGGVTWGAWSPTWSNTVVADVAVGSLGPPGRRWLVPIHNVIHLPDDEEDLDAIIAALLD